MIRTITGHSRPFSMLAFFSAVLLTLGACNKDKDDVRANLSFKEYKLLSATSADYGTVKISEKADGNATVAIQLSAPALIAGASFKASIISVVGADEFLYAKQLVDVDGGTGKSFTDPVRDAVTDVPIPYATLVGKTGYIIKITTVPAGTEYARATF